jgi:hypothetical protein
MSTFTDNLEHPDPAITRVIRDAIARAVAVAGLAGVALIHLLDAHDTFVSTPYKGVLYAMLIAGSLAAAAMLLRGSDPRAWAAAGALCLGTVVAFVYSRTIGLPQSADDIGNWWEPLGLASLFVEGAVVALSAAVLFERSRLVSGATTRAPRMASLARSTP